MDLQADAAKKRTVQVYRWPHRGPAHKDEMRHSGCDSKAEQKGLGAAKRAHIPIGMSFQPNNSLLCFLTLKTRLIALASCSCTGTMSPCVVPGKRSSAMFLLRACAPAVACLGAGSRAQNGGGAKGIIRPRT